MSRQTRSKTAATSQQDTANQDDLVPLNWVFFDRKKPRNKPRFIDVPRSLFDGRAQNCRNIFIAALREEHYFRVKREAITFWSPKGLLSTATVAKSGWAKSISEQEFPDSFKEILLTDRLAKALKGVDNEDAVHLVITAEGSYLKAAEEHDEDGDIATQLPEIKLFNRIVKTPGRSPSEGAKSKEYAAGQANPFEVIYDGRYPPQPQFATVAPPIQIFHPVFERFIRLVDDPTLQLSNEDLINVQGLMHILSSIDPDELERNSGIRIQLSKILAVGIAEERNTDGTSADGTYIFQVGDVRVSIVLIELKRDFGEAKSDPSHQVGLSMKRSWIQDNRAEIRNKCCCPTLMLAGGGAWLGVLGGVFTDKIIVQRLTDMMWVGHSSTEEDSRVYRFARVLVALRQCIQELSDFYGNLSKFRGFSPESNVTHPRFYPYPFSFEKDGKVVHFEYVKALETDAACVTYQAKITKEVKSSDIPIESRGKPSDDAVEPSDDEAEPSGDEAEPSDDEAEPSDDAAESPDIVVKFVTRYGKEVHEFLADHGHAPKLRYCGPFGTNVNLPADKSPSSSSGLSLGPMQMIVMDYISSCEKPPPDARTQLKAVLKLLDSQGFVLGDLRRQNVLFDQQGKVKIIDLDWAGRYKGTESPACYPLNISQPIRQVGAIDLAPISPQHDETMLKLMNLDA